MITVIFVCYGNICRSVSAELIAKDYLAKHKIENNFLIYSRGTSDEEYLNDIYPPMKRVLIAHNIPIKTHQAMQITHEDFIKADYILTMDEYNLKDLIYEFGRSNKIHLLGEYALPPFGSIADPWYTRDFEKAYRYISQGIEGFFDYILNKNKL